MTPEERRQLAERLRDLKKTADGLATYEKNARPKQLPPDHPRHHLPTEDRDGNLVACFDHNPHCRGPNPEWTTWLMLSGRGSGKTWAGAAWCLKMVLSDPGCSICVLAPTYQQVREACFERELLKIAKKWGINVNYNKNNLKIEFDNGSMIQGYSAENSETIRGGNFTYAWLDEAASYNNRDTYFQHLLPALRLPRGTDNGPSRMIITTTPKPTFLIRYWAKKAVADPKRFHVTRASTKENPVLSRERVDEIYEELQGKSALRRQEMEGELVLESDGAFFRMEDFDKFRVDLAGVPDLSTIVIGVDPATTSNVRSDETGIVVIGVGTNKHSYVLEDASLKGTPVEVMDAIERAYYTHDADVVIVENNQAGDYFRSLLEQKNAYIPCREVHAMKGKAVRAEPFGYLNQSGHIHMVGAFELLEEQLCSMTPFQDRAKLGDDRADAFVWAMKFLLRSVGGDYGEALGFIKCPKCENRVNWIKEKVCRNCGEPVVHNQGRDSTSEKAAKRWGAAYQNECERGHKFPLNKDRCPECFIDPSAYLAQVTALSAGNNTGWGYAGKNWLAGRRT